MFYRETAMYEIPGIVLWYNVTDHKVFVQRRQNTLLCMEHDQERQAKTIGGSENRYVDLVRHAGMRDPVDLSVAHLRQG